MVSITLSIPEDVRKKMKEFPEVNWSAFIRKLIDERVKQLTLKQELLSKLEEEEKSGFTDWTINMGRKAKEGSLKKLKEEGLL